METKGPGREIALLLQDGSARVRGLAAILAGKLDCAWLRPQLDQLACDADEQVQRAARWALKKLSPDGGRGGEIIRPHGGYVGLKAHDAAEIAYDATVAFCNRFIDRRSRTHDQMVQAARSGKQNIVEGSAAAGTSSKTELRLIGVARASLEEVLADFKDYLRQHDLARWSKDDPRMLGIRRKAYSKDRSYKDYKTYVEKESAEVAANTVICLVAQASYLLDRLKKQLEQAFIEHGGISERMLAARLQHRRGQGRE